MIELIEKKEDKIEDVYLYALYDEKAVDFDSYLLNGNIDSLYTN